MEKKTYVYFQLWEEYFAIDVMFVKEVIEMPQVVKVPAAPKFLLGLASYRGEVIPIIDLRTKFSLPEAKEKKYVIVVDYQSDEFKDKVGFVVDKVIDIISVEQYELSEYPELGSRYNVEFILGLLKYDDKFILVLNIPRILSEAEIQILKEIPKNIDTSSEQ